MDHARCWFVMTPYVRRLVSDCALRLAGAQAQGGGPVLVCIQIVRSGGYSGSGSEVDRLLRRLKFDTK